MPCAWPYLNPTTLARSIGPVGLTTPWSVQPRRSVGYKSTDHGQTAQLLPPPILSATASIEGSRAHQSKSSEPAIVAATALCASTPLRRRQRPAATHTHLHGRPATRTTATADTVVRRRAHSSCRPFILLIAPHLSPGGDDRSPPAAAAAATAAARGWPQPAP